ncbi:hypothetical protein RchiOBHm_Chr7g0205501 [Rosa chinensis]|uniref:Uncharacterized protein n=1 Tax=Rosa chinensis TaxID=74649 RepID=A0A2P6P8Z2_ROSCH|nr:hypothetical protein RchiOBHm_Chr7g0205501 [Rosa chinensis]
MCLKKRGKQMLYLGFDCGGLFLQKIGRFQYGMLLEVIVLFIIIWLGNNKIISGQ